MKVGSAASASLEQWKSMMLTAVLSMLPWQGVSEWNTASTTSSIHKYIKRKEKNEVLCRFQQLRSYQDEMEIGTWKKFPSLYRIVPRGLSVAERP